jgi:two-component system sensor histidine kinase HydH
MLDYNWPGYGYFLPDFIGCHGQCVYILYTGDSLNTMLPENETIRSGLKTSPWIILGASAILVAVVLVLTVQNIQREKRHMTQVLSAKGAALIRAVEAGTRTGMSGLMWGGRQVQQLLEETGRLPDVRYIAVMRPDGIVMAHSDPSRLGQPLRDGGGLISIGPDLQENHELVTLADGEKVFEVHRHFRPVRRRGPMHRERRHHMMGPMGRMKSMPNRTPGEKDWFDPSQLPPLFIVAGFTVTPFEEAIKGQLRNSMVLSALLLLSGFAGFVSLFWMQSYRAARRSLHDTSVFAKEVVAHLPVGMIATDANGQIAFFNAVSEEIFGLPQRSVIGKMPVEVMPAGIGELMAELDQGITLREREMVLDIREQQSIPVSVSATRIVNELEELVGYVLILRDLTEVRRLQEAIQRQEKLAAVGSMAAGVAHEIRNPLSSIKGMATYLAGEIGSNSEDLHAAQVMVQEVDRLNRVISELLDFARPSDITPRPTDLGGLLAHSLELIRQDAAAKAIEIELKMEASECPVSIDADRFTQCLLNLYLNAIEAMPGGGRLMVHCARDAAGGVVITISDTGTGIPPAHLSEIFNPYFTTKPSGAGLGLAIVHKIVEGHRGRINVHSSTGGTAFTLNLPCIDRGANDD